MGQWEVWRLGRRGGLLAAVLLGAGLWMGVALSLLRVDPGSAGALRRLAAELTPGERQAVLAGRVRFLDGNAAVRLAEARPTGTSTGERKPGRGRDGREVLVILNTPGVFRRGSDGGPRSGGGAVSDGQRVLAITRAAVRLGARLMVDCTDADLARLTPVGWESLLLAKRAHLWRLVVFDGAHHLPGLAADPEILLLPLLRTGGMDLIVHGYVRDALPLAGLRQVMQSAERSPLLLTLPRVSLPLKETLPLEFVALRILRLVAGGSGVAPPRISTGRREDSPPPGASLSGVVLGEAAARLPNGVVLAARREGAPIRSERLLPGARESATRTWVGVSHGNFALLHPPVPPPPGERSGGAAGARPEARLVQLGWPVSVWDLLLRYPAALAGAPLPWSPPPGPSRGLLRKPLRQSWSR
ncbi:MAG: hypothetical protein ACM3UP_01390, partial [Methanocella sp.]